MQMTSEKKIAANRNNAKSSTGPRTARGKSRTRSNALRHGLASLRLPEPAVSTRIERMAKAICGEGAPALHYQQALIIAESEVMVLNVRAARAAAIKRMRQAAPPAPSAVANPVMQLIASLFEAKIDGWPTTTEWVRAFEVLEQGKLRPLTRLLNRAARAVRAHDKKAAAADPNKDHKSSRIESEQPNQENSATMRPLAGASDGRPTQKLRDDIAAARLALPEITTLERYEHRALARRRLAIRKLERLRA